MTDEATKTTAASSPLEARVRPLVDRLRDYPRLRGLSFAGDLCLEAADEIERLRAALTPLERRVRPLRKADLARLTLLLDHWRREEANMVSHGLAVVPGSMRAKRIKDAAALQAALAFMLACRDLGRRPNTGGKPRE